MNTIDFNNDNYEEIFTPIEEIIKDFEKRYLFKNDIKKYSSRDYILTYISRNSRLSISIRYINQIKGSCEDRIIKRYPFDDTYINFETFLNLMNAFNNIVMTIYALYRNDITLEVL